MGLLSRIRTLRSSAAGRGALPVEKAVEGAPRAGPWFLPFSGGWLPEDIGKNWNWWQMGYDPVPAGTSAMVEACVSAYSQTIAMCPGNHWWSTGDGGRIRVVNSDLTRILRRPNEYQSISDFLLNATRSLYMRGNAYAVALRNDRREVDSLHLCSPQQTFSQVAEDGDVFYRCSGNQVLSEMMGNASIVVPARDVLHIKLHTASDDPLTGHSPIEAVALEMMASGAMSQQQLTFYLNQARPSFVLGTDAPLTLEQANELRQMWEAQSSGLAAGKTPILTRGLKPLPISTSSRDAQLADVMKLTDERIALAFRVPLAVLGMGPTPFASTEALMSLWKASGLGFALNHIEEAMGNFFRLKGQPDEYLEFDTAALLRSSFKERVDALAGAVKGSILSTNEARYDLEFPRVQHGQYVRGQAQDVPLGPPQPPSAPVAPVVTPAAALPAPAPDPEEDPEENLSPEIIRAVAFSSLSNVLLRYDENQNGGSPP